MFWVLIGESLGNFGVITHVILKPLKDEDYSNIRAIKLSFIYNANLMKDLIQFVLDVDSFTDHDASYHIMLSYLSRRRLDMFPTATRIVESWPNVIGVYLVFKGGKDAEFQPRMFENLATFTSI